MSQPDLKILIGPKNRSTWSLRAWLLLAHYGIPFVEDRVDYNLPDGKARLNEISPSGWVPVIWHEGIMVWDTLAIAEYLAEAYPTYQMWPADRAARARARSIVAEMHSGYADMRNEMTMFFAESREGFTPSAACQANIDRIQTIFTTCREQHGADGPFLFGRFSIADAFYAPVVSRFRTWGIGCEGAAAIYCETMWSLPSMQQWLTGAQAELLEGEG